MPATFEMCQKIIAPGGTIANIGVHGVKVDLHLENLGSSRILVGDFGDFRASASQRSGF
jgi:alcohol dehydrogenase